MHVTEVRDHMLINDSGEKEDLLLRIRRLCPHKRGSILLVSEEHEALHLPHVLHELILLHQVRSHARFNHIPSRHVTPNGSLENHGICLNVLENLLKPAHSEDRLDPRGNLVDVVNTATDNQALEPLLDFLGGDVQT